MPLNAKNIQEVLSIIVETDLLANTMYKVLPQYSNIIALVATFTPQEWAQNIKNAPMGLKMSAQNAMDKIKSFGRHKNKKTLTEGIPTKQEEKPNNNKTSPDTNTNQPKEKTLTEGIPTKQEEKPTDPNADKENYKPYADAEGSEGGTNQTDTSTSKDDNRGKDNKISDEEQGKADRDMKKGTNKKKQQINKRYRLLKKEKKRRGKNKGKSDNLFNGAQRTILNIAKYVPIIGSLICAIDSGVGKISGMSEKPLKTILKFIKSLITLIKISRKVGSIVDGIQAWAKLMFSTVETIILPILIFFTFPLWIIIYPIFNIGPISRTLKPAEKKLKKIVKKIQKLILKATSIRKIDTEMKDLRQQLKNLK